MTKINEIYKCSVCGNIVEVVHESSGELVCCSQPMNLMRENSVDAAKEKHVPIVQVSGVNVMVKVGELAHPMDDDHYIEWIEVITEKRNYRANLKPGDVANVSFTIGDGEEVVKVRAYCNLHGLWKNK